MRLTIIIKKGKSGYLVGQLKEFPAVFTQGKTITELKSNIKDVLELYVEDLRENYDHKGEKFAEEELYLHLNLRKPSQFRNYMKS